jgi:hypothetical protein
VAPEGYPARRDYELFLPLLLENDQLLVPDVLPTNHLIFYNACTSDRPKHQLLL